ncbi:MAG: T9SS type A sorting domain-containing protein, partial [Bacteroidota bacterium]
GITNTNPTMSGIDDWNLSWTNTNPPSGTAELFKNSENILVSGFIGNDIRFQTKKATTSTTTVRLTNLSGAILWEKQYTRLQAGQTEWIRPGNLAKGIYLLQIQNAEERITKRLAN